jgi:MFS transporter, DHA3 family, macrolide efflux protein
MAQPITVSSTWKRTFFPIWIGQIFSLIGSGLVNFALVWYLTEKTGSATVLAMATLVAILPDVIIGPFAGALVDRLNRRAVMIIADASIALASVVLGLIFWAGIVQPWHIYVIMFLRSVGGVFHWPAMQASTSLMVPSEHLSRVAGLNQALRGSVNIFAPPLGALLITLMPYYGILGIDVVTALLAILPLFFVVIPQPVKSAPDEIITPIRLAKDVGIAFKYVVAWKGLFSVILLALGINFVLAPSGTLLPLMVTKIFSGNAWHLSALEVASGIGIVLGGVALGIWGGFRKKIYTSLVGVIFIGFGVFLMGIAPGKWFWLAIVSSAILGLMSPIANGPLHAIMQERVAPEMQGRVFTLISAGASAMMPVAMIIAGPVSDWLGIRIWFIVGGSLTILAGLFAFANREITHIEDKMSDQEMQTSIEPAGISPITN